VELGLDTVVGRKILTHGARFCQERTKVAVLSHMPNACAHGSWSEEGLGEQWDVDRRAYPRCYQPQAVVALGASLQITATGCSGATCCSHDVQQRLSSSQSQKCGSPANDGAAVAS
ncbi:unnamed protein product, partial [Ectocarpus sp. 12 AP-2014]